jgi:heme-degrading monooxygenase HmoA
VTSLKGAPAANRVSIQQWDSLEKLQAWRNSAEFKKAREIGDKYAKFRSEIHVSA